MNIFNFIFEIQKVYLDTTYSFWKSCRKIEKFALKIQTFCSYSERKNLSTRHLTQLFFYTQSGFEYTADILHFTFFAISLPSMLWWLLFAIEHKKRAKVGHFHIGCHSTDRFLPRVELQIDHFLNKLNSDTSIGCIVFCSFRSIYFRCSFMQKELEKRTSSVNLDTLFVIQYVT